jgi:hypothetical protein
LPAPAVSRLGSHERPAAALPADHPSTEITPRSNYSGLLHPHPVEQPSVPRFSIITTSSLHRASKWLAGRRQSWRISLPIPTAKTILTRALGNV